LAILAARATSTTQAKAAALKYIDANVKTDATKLLAGLFYAAQKFDENYVPAEDRICALKPAQYYLMAQNSTVQSNIFNAQGSPLNTGRLPTVAGIDIVKSNNVPSTDLSASVTGENNTYTGDFSVTGGVVFHKTTLATLRLMGLTMEQDYLTQKQATLLVVKQAVGHGILRPQAACEFTTA
jgi:hypothetical protein